MAKYLVAAPPAAFSPRYPTAKNFARFADMMNLSAIVGHLPPTGWARAPETAPRSRPKTETMGLDLDGIDAGMTFLPADTLVMSCGTVTMDLARGMVLLLWNKKLQIYQLPKGRRNIDESMLAAAIRETYEETGVSVTPLWLDIATRATPVADGPTPGKNPQITNGHHSNEFLGACLYQDPQSTTSAVKAVFFFAATADSTAAPAAGTQEEWEKFDTCWVPVAEIPGKLFFKAEVSMVFKALEDVKKTGYSIGA